MIVASPSAKYISIKVDKFIDSSPVQVLFCIFLTKDNKFPVFAGDIFWMNHSFGSHVTIVIKMLIFGHRDKEEYHLNMNKCHLKKVWNCLMWMVLLYNYFQVCWEDKGGENFD